MKGRQTTEHIAGAPESPSTYINKGCRCDGCRTAHTVYLRRRNANPEIKANRNAYVRERRATPGTADRTAMKTYSRARDLAVQWVRRNRPDVWAELRSVARQQIEQKQPGGDPVVGSPHHAPEEHP